MGVPGSIGEFQPFAELSRGPVTVVYKAYQQSLSRVVLLKVLRARYNHVDEIVERFEDEARLVAQIQHPNVVTIHSYGREGDRSFFVAEFVEGVDLAALLGQHDTIPLELGTYIIREVAKGLGAAHEQGILHRDIKPGNIMIGSDGQVKLTDFGMASIVETEADGEVRGTPGYLAPEQLSDDSTSQGQASDLFALGATSYEVIVGRRAFPDTSISESIDAVLHNDPLKAIDLQRSVPEDLKEVLANLLAKCPEDRWCEVSLLIDALERFRTRYHMTAGAVELTRFIDDPSGYVPAAVVAETGDGAPSGAGPHELPPEVSESSGEDAAPTRDSGARPWRAAAIGFAVLLIAAGGYFFSMNGWKGLDTTERVQGNMVFLPDSLGQPEPVLGDWRIYPVPGAVNADDETDPTVGTAPDPPESAREDWVDERATDSATLKGSLIIHSTPNAMVYVGDDTMGHTPMDAPVEMDAGRYRLLVRHPEYPDYRDSVTVVSNEERTVHVYLESLVGRLDIEVSPWAEVSIDGVVRDTIPPQVAPFVLSPGGHSVTLRHPEYGIRDTLLRVNAGETHRIEYSFQESIE